MNINYYEYFDDEDISKIILQKLPDVNIIQPVHRISCFGDGWDYRLKDKIEMYDSYFCENHDEQ